MSRRVWLNLGVFLLLFFVLAFWAVRNVISFDFIERPYTVTAEFTTSPGLRPNFEVSYLGRRVGKISSVALAGDRVEVELDIDRGTELPAELTAAVRRKSAIGEPYVDLSPLEGHDDGDLLEEGGKIPLERTTTPLAYSELFAAVDTLVSAVPAEDLSTLVRELAAGLQGRGDSVRTVLQSVSDLTTSLADDTELLDQLTVDLTRLARTISTHRESLASSTDNVALLAETLAANRANIGRLLDQGFTEKVGAVLDSSESDINCLVTGLATVLTRISDPSHLDELRRLLTVAPKALEVLQKVFIPTGTDGSDGPFLEGTFILNAGDSQLPVYPQPGQLPRPPIVPACALSGSEPAGQSSSGAAAGGPSAPSSQEGALDRTPRVPPAVDTTPSSTLEPSSGLDIGAMLGDALRLAPIALVIAGLVVLSRRRRASQAPSAAEQATEKETVSP